MEEKQEVEGRSRGGRGEVEGRSRGQRPGPSGRSPVVKHTDLPPRGVGGRAPDHQKGANVARNGPGMVSTGC